MQELNTRKFFQLKTELNKKIDSDEIILDQLKWFLRLSKEDRERLSGCVPVDLASSQFVSKYRAIVDYDKTTVEMIDLIGCKKYDYRIPMMFSVDGGGEKHMDFELIQFLHPMPSETVIEEIARNNLVPANLIELLAFVYQYPEFQADFPIVALNSSHTVDGYRRVVFIHDDDGEGPRLEFQFWEGDWNNLFRILAVRK